MWKVLIKALEVITSLFGDSRSNGRTCRKFNKLKKFVSRALCERCVRSSTMEVVVYSFANFDGLLSPNDLILYRSVCFVKKLRTSKLFQVLKKIINFF